MFSFRHGEGWNDHYDVGINTQELTLDWHLDVFDGKYGRYHLDKHKYERHKTEDGLHILIIFLSKDDIAVFSKVEVVKQKDTFIIFKMILHSNGISLQARCFGRKNTGILWTFYRTSKLPNM